MGIYARDNGEWYRVDEGGSAAGGTPGAAVIGDATGAVTTSSFTGDGTNGDDGQAYDVYEFTGSGKLVVSEPGFVDALVLGGGGAGGTSFYSRTGAGGGAGGLINDQVYFPTETYTVTIGAGASSGSGGTTSIWLYAALGGGRGANGVGAGAGQKGSSGGCGGGSTGTASSGGQPIVIAQGFAGHQGNDADNQSGGGGGTSASPTAVNAGGAGTVSTITNGDITYGTGGKAGSNATGAANTGNGGGGASAYGSTAHSGGSGIVIVRVKVASESYPFRTKTTAPKTAHAARIEDDVVRQVIVIPHLDDDDNKITQYCNSIGLPGTWVDTSYTGSRRGKYAGVGDMFDINTRNAEFVSPQIETAAADTMIIDGRETKVKRSRKR